MGAHEGARGRARAREGARGEGAVHLPHALLVLVLCGERLCHRVLVYGALYSLRHALGLGGRRQTSPQRVTGGESVVQRVRSRNPTETAPDSGSVRETI